MLRRMAGPGGVGVSEQQQQQQQRRHTGIAASAASALPPPLMVPPTKLFLAQLAAGSGGGVSREEVSFSPPPELARAAAIVVMVSPTSTLQAPTGSPTSAAATAAPFSRCGATATSSSSGGGGDDDIDRRRSQQQRPWEARPVGVGLAGALNALPPAATVLTTGQRIRPCQSSAPPPSSALAGSPERRSRSRSRCRCVLSPREMMEASWEEDYTRVIARGANPRTTHIFEDRVVVVVEEDEFLRWCHGCSKELGHGSDIFMYRGEMAFCSHECRYREMLRLDEQEEQSS